VLTQEKEEEHFCDEYYDSIQSPLPCANYYIFVSNNNTREFIDEWRNGDVHLVNDAVIKNKLLRYNGYLDEVIWLRTEDYKMGKLYKSQISSFRLYANEENKECKYVKKTLPWDLNSESEDVFLEVLVEGTYEFYAFRQMKRNHNANEVFPRFLYFIKYENKYTRIKLRQSELIRLFDKDLRPNVRRDLRQARLKYRTEEDMIHAIEHLNKNFKVSGSSMTIQ
jgi:hypothetical protein